MNWIAYCKDCQSVIDEAPNGQMVEAAAKMHQAACDFSTSESGLARVLVGYWIKGEAGATFSGFPTFGLREVSSHEVATLDGIHSEVGLTLLKDGFQTYVSIKLGEEIHVVAWHNLIRAIEALSAKYLQTSRDRQPSLGFPDPEEPDYGEVR